MPRKLGIIYQTDKGEYALALNSEQHENFEKVGKVYVHLFDDIMCTKPKISKQGSEATVLKSVDKVKMIGFSD